MNPTSLADFMRETPLLIRGWLLGAIATIGLSILMLPLMEGYNILDLQFAYSKVQFVSVIQQMSPEAQQGFGMHYRYDFLYPVAYSLWMSTTLAWVMRRAESTPLLNALIYLPMLAALFDLAENSFIAPYALDFTQVTDQAVYWQSVCAGIKYGLLAISAATIVLLAPKALRQL